MDDATIKANTSEGGCMNRDRLLRELRWLAEGTRATRARRGSRQNRRRAADGRGSLLSTSVMGKSPMSSTRYEEVIRHKIRFCTPCFG